MTYFPLCCRFATPAGLVFAALALLGGCSSLDRASAKVAGVVTPYSIEIVQGNVVTREQLAALPKGAHWRRGRHMHTFAQRSWWGAGQARHTIHLAHVCVVGLGGGGHVRALLKMAALWSSEHPSVPFSRVAGNPTGRAWQAIRDVMK